MALRIAACALALNRVAFGLGYLAAPERTASSWIGRKGRSRQTTVLTRALGARDLMLGVCALNAMARRDAAEAKRWFAAHAVADLADFAATQAARDKLPESGYRFGSAMAAASTAIAAAAAVALRD
jgi:hypothetical protein